MEDKPSAVPQATQGGTARERFPYAEPSVWTDPMLTALETGVKGGRWYSLMDKVLRPETLHAAWDRVRANHGAAGVDRETVERFERHRGENLRRLHEQLRDERYAPRAVRRVWIDKPGKKGEKRPLGIPTVRDRVVQTALRYALEPIFEAGFAPHSYGFRPGRGCKDALRRVEELLKGGCTHVVDADLKSYFDTIPHEGLMRLIERKISDGRVLDLLRAYLKQGVMDGLRTWTPEAGTPQGAIVSPLLSNVYLDPLDHHMAQQGYEMVRYADDFVVLCRGEEEARRALEAVRVWTEANGLTLHPEKTRVVDDTVRGGFDFLGYHFERGMKWPAKKSQRKLRDNIRRRTRRAHGHSLERIVSNLNPVIRGWFQYFKHSKRNTFEALDGWIRGRLRAILRKRRHGKGRARGADHQRWPNAFFADLGLVSMVEAQRLASQPARR